MTAVAARFEVHRCKVRWACGAVIGGPLRSNRAHPLMELHRLSRVDVGEVDGGIQYLGAEVAPELAALPRSN